MTVEHSLQIDSPLTSFPIWQMGGAVAASARTRPPSTAARRGFTYNIGGSTDDAEGFDDEREWVRDFWSALEPWHRASTSTSSGTRAPTAIRHAYGAGEVRPAAGAEAQCDPDNFFRINQNIPPA